MSSGVQAQTKTPAPRDKEVEEVVVTGTNIRGIAAVGQNVVGITREEINSSPAVTTLDLLRKVPQIVNLGADDSNTTGQGGAFNATGGQGLNVRGLGPLATLTLMDGYRLPSQGSQGQFTDPSVVPTIAVERLEVIADGSSAIYGADAIAGVVNLITRKRFEGAETQVRYGVAGGDYNTQSYGQIVGKRWDTGGAVLAVEYNKRSQLLAADRDWFSSDLRSRGASDFRSTNCSPGNILIGATTYAIPATGVTPATANQLVAGTQNRCDNAKLSGILPSQERINALLHAHQELTPWLSVFAEILYNNRNGVPVNPAATANLTVPSTNAFFVTPVPGRTTVSVQYVFPVALQNRTRRKYFARGYDAMVGADLKLPFEWQGQLTYRKGYTVDDTTNSQSSNPTTLAAALADSNPATALNPFNPNAVVPAATADSIFSRSGFIDAWVYDEDFLAKADGKLFNLPGGAVRLAVGASYRKERFAANLTISGAPIASGNHRHSAAAYVEAYVPLVGPDNQMPLAQRLELSLAGRYENYSDFGTTFNPKVGVTWQPVHDLVLRGTYGTSFRAPTLVESDPLSVGTGLYPINFRDPKAPSGFSQGFSIGGGNAGIQPETATTYSVGGEFRPEFLPGLSLSLTYFKVTYEDQILPLQGDSTVLQNEAFYSQYIIRNPSLALINSYRNSGLPLNGTIDFSNVQVIVVGTSQNRGVTNASGFDYAADYQFKTPIGEAMLGVDGAYFTEFTAAPSTTAPSVDVLNTYLNPLRHRARVFAGLRHGQWDGRFTVNYQNAYDNPIAPILKTVSSYTTVDLHLGYNFGDEGSRWLRGIGVSVDAQNIFDKDPPLFDLAGGYDPHNASAVGRLVNFSLRKRW